MMLIYRMQFHPGFATGVAINVMRNVIKDIEITNESKHCILLFTFTYLNGWLEIPFSFNSMITIHTANSIYSSKT